MIRQAFGDLLDWGLEHPWHLLGGVVGWMVLSVGVALIAGPVVGGVEYDEPDDDVSRWLR